MLALGLFFTCLGIPLALLVAVALVVASVVGTIALGLWLGERLLGQSSISPAGLCVPGDGRRHAPGAGADDSLRGWSAHRSDQLHRTWRLCAGAALRQAPRRLDAGRPALSGYLSVQSATGWGRAWRPSRWASFSIRFFASSATMLLSVMVASGWPRVRAALAIKVRRGELSSTGISAFQQRIDRQFLVQDHLGGAPPGGTWPRWSPGASR